MNPVAKGIGSVFITVIASIVISFLGGVLFFGGHGRNTEALVLSVVFGTVPTYIFLAGFCGILSGLRNIGQSKIRGTSDTEKYFKKQVEEMERNIVKREKQGN